MSDTKFTPGPWRVDGEALRAMVRGADATIVAVRHRLPAAVNVPNMHLIAAAPDLYAALAETLERYVDLAGSGDCGHWDPETEDQVKAARAALAKARGEKP